VAGYTAGALVRLPLVRIDYVLHDGTWAARGAWTQALPGSDHRAVIADVALVGRGS
jgi:hypothetical protein